MIVIDGGPYIVTRLARRGWDVCDVGFKTRREARDFVRSLSGDGSRGRYNIVSTRGRSRASIIFRQGTETVH